MSLNVRLWIRLSAAAFALFFFWSAGPARAQNGGSQAFPPELEADLSAGATAVYHLDFQAAQDHLNHAVQLRPDHPAAYFFFTMLSWYELTYDSMLQRNPALEKRIEDQADKAISVSKKFIKNGGPPQVGHLYWGGGLGAKGWFYVSRGQYARAYFAGKKGYNFMRKAIEIDPELYDAYLGVGMYEYYAATLGPVLKALSSILVRGNKEQAMRYLKVAQTQSRYVKLEAAYFQWNGAMDEGRLGEARAMAQTLVEAFPHSPLFRWCEIQTLFFQREWEAALKRGEDFIAAAHAGPHPEHYVSPFRLMLAKVYYHCGLAARNLKKNDLAKSYFSRAAHQSSEFQGWRALSHLRLGEFQDLDGRRQEALDEYRKVLALPDVWSSHDMAKKRLRFPYQNGGHNGNGVIVSPLQLWQNEIK